MQDNNYLFICLPTGSETYHLHLPSAQQSSRSNSALRIRSTQEQADCKASRYPVRSLSTAACIDFHTKEKSLQMSETESFFVH